MNHERMDMEYPKLNIMELLRGLLKSAVRMLIPGILAVALLSGFMCLRTWRGYVPRYQAVASFTVQMKNPFYATQQYYNNAAAEQMAKTFPQILTSGLLSDRVKGELGITAMPAVTATAVGNTNIFTLTVTSTDPQEAYEVLNCLIEVYPSVADFVIGASEVILLSQSGMPEMPYNSPRYVQSLTTGATLGVALWAALSLFYWLTHKTVANEEDLSKLINLPCLGYLHNVRGTDKDSCPLLVNVNDKFGFNESVRLLRVRVEKAMAEQNSKVLLITSTIPNEGKTTLSVNLAVALAQKGKKVLLMDCDLRNPSVGGMLSIDNQLGLAEFLKGECSAKDIVQTWGNDKLHVVLAGKGVSDPGKLLAQSNTKMFIEKMREAFDCIILDTPPCAMMADAADIGEYADASLLAVRFDFAVRQQIQEAVQTLSDNEKPILGTVFNMANPKKGKGAFGGYYGHYGTYGTYGSYGHTSYRKEEKE